MSVWFFVRLGPGDLRPLPPEEMEAFLKAERPLPADSERLVHYVGLEVGEDRGAIMTVGRTWFGRCPVREDGTLDQRAMLAQVNARVAAHSRLADWRPGTDVVVDARDVFEARRRQHETRWEPTESDLTKLKALVNARAGWNIL